MISASDFKNKLVRYSSFPLYIFVKLFMEFLARNFVIPTLKLEVLTIHFGFPQTSLATVKLLNNAQIFPE